MPVMTMVIDLRRYQFKFFAITGEANNLPILWGFQVFRLADADSLQDAALKVFSHTFI